MKGGDSFTHVTLMKLRNLLLTLSLLGLYFLFSSHELFLKMKKYQLAPQQQAELFLFNGTFDTSENVITRDRIVEAHIWGPDYDRQPKASDYYDEGTATYLRFPTGEAGTYVAGISTVPRTIELDAEAFLSYLEHEELSSIIAAREEQGLSDQPAREEYAKHVKAIFQVGDQRSDHYGLVLGYPIEFIPLSNPYEGQVGQPMAFQLLYEGRPLAGQTVHYSVREPGAKQGPERTLRTDARGRFTLSPDQPGQWYLATIHMTERPEEDLDYESQWATLTFAVQ